jgi:hypothetical protein
MIFGYFTLFVALTISAVAEFYSIVGLTAIFSAAFWPIVIMGASLGVGKVTAAVWLKLNWERASWTYKLYLVPAVAFLMLLTSMGIFGFLSKAHSDQSLVTGDSQSKVAIYDEKIKTAKDNIDANRKALKQMDEAVDQVMGRSADEKGAEKAVAIRRGQTKERTRLLSEIAAEQKVVAQLSEERAPLAAEFRKVEAEVGPIKYIAALVYGDNPDANILEKAVRLVIILIVAVFDPLALVLILAAQQSIRWAKEEKDDYTPGEVNKHTQPSGLEQVTQESTVEEQDAVATAPAADAEPIVQEVTAEPQTTVDPLAYLKQPFVHFENLQPMVHKPEVVEKPEIYAGNPDDFKEPWPEGEKEKLVAAMQTFFDKNKETQDEEAIESEVGTQQPDQDQVELEQEFLDRFDENLAKNTIDILTMGIDEVERPGDYLTPPEPEYTGPMKEIVEEYVDPNTRIKTLNHRWVPDLSATPDNAPDGIQANADFGTTFPVNATKGDMHVRVDFLPPRLFKFNGVKWMEVDKSMTDSHYSDEYIKHLIDKINSGEYAVEDLSESEQDQIREYLSKNNE